jgi:hypothetical protein
MAFLKIFWRQAAIWELWPQVLVLVSLAAVFLTLARLLRDGGKGPGWIADFRLLIADWAINQHSAISNHAIMSRRCPGCPPEIDAESLGHR